MSSLKKLKPLNIILRSSIIIHILEFYELPISSLESLSLSSFYGYLKSSISFPKKKNDEISKKKKCLFIMYRSILIDRIVSMNNIPWKVMKNIEFNQLTNCPKKFFLKCEKVERLINIEIESIDIIKEIEKKKLKKLEVVLCKEVSELSTRKLKEYLKLIKYVKCWKKLVNNKQEYQLIEIQLKRGVKKKKRKRKRKRKKISEELPIYDIKLPMSLVSIGVLKKDIKVVINQKVNKGDVLCGIFTSDNKFTEIYSPCDGNVVQINQKNDYICSIKGCSHPEICFGICIICNKIIFDNPSSSIDENESVKLINFVHGDLNLKISKNEAIIMDKEYQERLLKERKLILILDLDHTLVHCVNSNLSSIWYSKKSQEDLRKNEIFHFKLQNVNHFVKLRPNVRWFLKKMSERYELHIWTHGTKEYSLEIQKIIDPDKRYFGNRVVSRDDCANLSSKTLRNKFPSNFNKVLIIDDREDVWREHKDHLLRIHAYVFFTGGNEINNLPGENNQLDNNGNTQQTDIKFTIDKFCLQMDERLKRKDDQLIIFSKVLENIYNSFFQDKSNNDVSILLMKEKSMILSNCNVMFSRLIPIGTKSENSSYWKKALELGAFCYKEYNEKITHIIVSSTTTESTQKMNLVREKGHVFVVNEKWLLETIKRWKRQNEYDYIVHPKINTPIIKNHVKGKEEIVQFQTVSKEMMTMIQKSKERLNNHEQVINDLVNDNEDDLLNENDLLSMLLNDLDK